MSKEFAGWPKVHVLSIVLLGCVVNTTIDSGIRWRLASGLWLFHLILVHATLSNI